MSFLFNKDIFKKARIPSNVTEEIDILKDIDPEILDIILDLETTDGIIERAKKAQNYVEQFGGISEIDYVTLGNCLKNHDLIDIQGWQQLYLIERSIPSRYGNTYTWLERLKMFYNTFIREKAIVDTYIPYKNTKLKLHWVKGNDKNPTNHDKLVANYGQFGADFYIFDNDIIGSTVDKMVKVEMKYSNVSVKEAALRYRTETSHLYGSSYLILAMSTGEYYLVEYTPEENKITKLDTICSDIFQV